MFGLYLLTIFLPPLVVILAFGLGLRSTNHYRERRRNLRHIYQNSGAINPVS